MELRRSSRPRKRQNTTERGAASRVDRLSSLPEAIISIILSFLPTKNVVATSVLAKSWKLRWREVTSFDVDDGLDPKKHGLMSELLRKMNFGEFVDKVFDNQTADSPNHFCLCCQYPGRVLCYAAYEMRLAATLFDREHLKVLKLAGPMMINLPDLPCLPKLVVLELNCVRYMQKETLSDLISSCPMLHSLTLKRNTKLDKLKVCTIASPTLKHLEIFFNFDPDYPYWQHDLPASDYKARELKRVKLEIDAPALEYLNVEDTMSREISIRGLTSVREVGLETRSCNGFINTLVADLVQSLDHAKFLKLGGNVVQALSIANANNIELSGNFESWLLLMALLCIGAAWFV